MPKATIKQVAAEAGVSTATVSRVLTGSGYVSDEVKVRVHEAADRLNYEPNAIARSLKQDKTHTIGIVVPDIANPFFMSLSRGIEDEVHPENYNLIFCSSDENSYRESSLLQMLREKRVDAVALATAGSNEELLAKLSRSGLPIVLLDRNAEHQDLALDLVAEDNVRGAYELTRRLIGLGHTRIGVINGHMGVSTGRDRYEGFLRAIRELELPEQPPVYEGHFSTGGGVKAVEYFLSLDPKPTALVSFNNQMTFGVLLELTRRGLRIPYDLVVASYGEVEAARLLAAPGLLYVQQTPYQMGRRAGAMLLKRIRKESGSVSPEKVIFQPVIWEL